MAERNSTRDRGTSVVPATSERLTVSFYQDDDPKTLWVRLHGTGLSETGFNPNATVRVRLMRGCLLITSD